MDFLQVSKYFDRLDFDTYSFVTGQWSPRTYKGQVKVADKFVTLYNRPTRKRLMYTAHDVNLTAKIVRLSDYPADVYMVGTGQSDYHQNTRYRQVTGVHLARNTAVLRRLTPAMDGSKSTWATNQVVRNTWADIEIRSVDESQDRRIDNFGHYFLMLPGDEKPERQDTLELEGVTYTILETYDDGGLIYARVVNTPEERKDFIYFVKTGEAYDINTQTSAPQGISYRCTGKITPSLTQETAYNDETESIRVMLHDRFISFEPKLKDVVKFLGKNYQVTKVMQNSLLSEWYILAVIQGSAI